MHCKSSIYAVAALAVLGSGLASPLSTALLRPLSSTWERTRKNVSASEAPLPEYPRPMLVRAAPTAHSTLSPQSLRDRGDKSNWISMNGLWEWEQDTSGGREPPFGRTLNQSILVPFPVESCLSGVAPKDSKSQVKSMWYRILFSASPKSDKLVLLHFGAIDWQSVIYVDKKQLANHTGGYDAITVDVTDAIASAAGGPVEILVHVLDPSETGAQPNGKQSASRISNPGGDTYTPTSGIWQTVWLEWVPTSYVSSLQLGAGLERLQVTANVVGKGGGPVADTVTYTVLLGSKVVATAPGQAGSETVIPIPAPQHWSPSNPVLYDLKVETQGGGDAVLAYFGMRTFRLGQFPSKPVPPSGPQSGVDRPGSDMPGSPFALKAADPSLCYGFCNSTAGCAAWAYAVPGCDQYTGPMCWLKSSQGSATANKCRVSGTQGHQASNVTRPLLNGKFTFMAGWLDQSFWPDGQYTAPSDAALAFDLESVKTFGMNMVRLHQKVNSERWYWHADRIGVAIYQDAVQKYGGATKATVDYFVGDLTAMIQGRGNHPCIVQWETFNEGDCWSVFDTPPYTVQDIVQLARKLDWQNRLVDTDSGGGANNAPFNVGDVNDIHDYPNPKDPKPTKSMYAMVGEFGGIGAFVEGKEWVPGQCHTYLHVDTPADEANTYISMTTSIAANIVDISASVYTQITDVELECDGFLNYDRTNKFTKAQTADVAAANQALIDASTLH